jgi:hypothetical protein
MRAAALWALWALASLAVAATVATRGGPVTRGVVMVCYQKYRGELVPSQALINANTWRASPQAKREYLQCFTSGRGNHRSGPVRAPEESLESRDWGVTVRVHQNATSNVYEAVNARREPVRFELNGQGNNVFMDTTLPYRSVLLPRSARDVLAVTRVPGAPVAGFRFEWRAEPARFWQPQAFKQISSNGVTVVVESTPTATYFSAYNDRQREEDTVSLTLDLRPLGETRASNLELSRGLPVSISLKPGQKRRRFLRVRPVRIGEPWLFIWNYKWVSGASPRQLFGVDK